MSVIRMGIEDYVREHSLLNALPDCLKSKNPVFEQEEVVWYFEHKGDDWVEAWIYLCELDEGKIESGSLLTSTGVKPAFLGG